MSDDDLKHEVEKERKALRSLVAFREEYIPSRDDVAPAPFHEDWSEILLNGTENFAIEAFRESAKTQIVIRANLLHALTYPQEKRSYLVIICATQTRAGQMLQGVTRDYLSSKDMNGLLSKVHDNSERAFEAEYQNGRRVRIEAYGKGAALRGIIWGSRRPDLIIIDDPQDSEDARSETVTANDWDWFLSDVYFLGKQSRIFLIGNNLGERCIIERVMRGEAQLNFVTRRIPILGPDGKSTWPSKWPTREIEDEREKWALLGKTDIWYRERMCRSISPDSQKFKREYFRYYEKAPSLSELNVYTTVDLAVSQKANADYSAIVTVGVNSSGHWFVLDVEYGRYDPSTTMDAIFSAVRKWRPLSVGIEAVAYQSALLHFLEREMPKRGIFFRITPLKAEKKKELRIDTLQPRFAVGTVWFKAGAAWREKIESELLAYPNGAHDDVIDALAYVEQVANEPYQTREWGGEAKGWNPIAGMM